MGNRSSQALFLIKDVIAPSLLSLRGSHNNKVNASNQSAYLISGDCNDSSSTISFSVNSQELGRVACDGTSFEKDLDLQAFSDGSLRVALRVEDSFGNFSLKNLNLTKDIVAPILSSVAGENSGRVKASNQNAYTVSGSCDDDSATISFSSGSDSLGSVACDGASFTKDLDLQSLSDGSLRIALSIEDDFGNSSLKTLELEKDIVSPVLSSVAGENSGRVNFLNQSAYTVSGSCDDATATISFSSGSESLGSVVCDGTSFEKALDLQSLSDGSFRVTLKIEDSFGNLSLKTLELEKDIVASVLSSVAGENSGRVNFLNQSAYTVSGSCDDDSATISFSSGSESLGSVVCDGTDFQKDLDLQSLSDGSLRIALSIEDSFGNSSLKNLNLTKDIVAPVLSFVAGENSGRVNFSNQSAYTVSGSCDDATATISFSSGSESLGRVVCDGTSFEKDLDLQSLSEGSLRIALSIEDSFGNSSLKNLNLTKDIVAPVLSSVAGENSGRVNVLNQSAYTVSGSCDDDFATISFSSGSESLGSVACDGASFTKDLDLQSLSEGSLRIALSIEDSFGNSSLKNLNLTKDIVAPVLSSVVGENSGRVNVLNQSAYTISGSCDDDSATISFSSGSESLGSVACDGTSFEKELDLQSLSEGSFRVALRIEDVFGNFSLENLELEKNIVAPVLSSVIGENSGRVNFSNQSAYTVSGRCDDASATISFSSGSESLGSVACDGASFTKDLDLQSLSDGSLQVALKIEDSFGNSSLKNLELEKDVVAPVLSSVIGENSDRVNASNQSAYTVSGSCDDATATISFSIGSDSLGSVACDGTDFQKDLDLQSLSDGSFSVTVKIEDSFGNLSLKTLELEKDVVFPVLSSVTGENRGLVNDLNQSAYTVSGSCDDASATISFSSSSDSLGSVVCDGTSFEKDLDLQSLSESSFSVTVKIEDSFGNLSLKTLELEKDVVLPVLSSVAGENSGRVNTLNQSAYTVSGSCDDASAMISFSSGSDSLGSVACDGASFTKDLDLQSLSESPLSLALKIEDRFGNSSLTNLELEKDTVSPVLSSVVGENSGQVNDSNQSAYTVSGNCDDATATLSFSIGSESLGSVVCDGAGFTKDLDLQDFSDGSLRVALSIEDGFGNSSLKNLNLKKGIVAPVLSSVVGENSGRVNFSNQSAYTVSGSCDDDSATISFSIGSESLGSVACDGTGFTKDLDLQPLSESSFSVALKIEDSFGNSSLKNLELEKDVVAPVLSSVIGENSGRVNFSNQSAYTVSGSCNDDSATISFSSGSDSLGSVACDGTNFEKDLDLQSLSESSFSVALKIEDGFGNSSLKTLALTKDIIPPVLSSVAGENSGRVKASNQNAYTVSGSCDDDSAMISFSSGSESLGSVACDGAGFTKDLDLQSLSDGSLQVALKIEDRFGNSNVQNLELEKDTVAPVLSAVMGENSGRVKASNQNAYTVSGSCDDVTATISFSIGSDSLGSVACDGANFEKDLDLQSLSESSFSVTVKIEDSFGNSGLKTLELEKDTVFPVLSSVAGENSGRVKASNQSAYTVSGSCDDATAMISFSSGSQSLGRVACDGTSFEKDLDLQSLSDGSLQVALKIEDDFGNSSLKTLELEKDTVAPVLSSVVGENSGQVKASNQNAYTVSGSCDDATATISFSSGSESLGSVACDGAGFTKDVDLQSLSDGSFNVSLSIEDGFGNSSVQDLGLNKDTVVPVLSSIVGENSGRVNFSNQSAYTVSGRCDKASSTISFSSHFQSLGHVVCDGASFEKDLDLQSFSDGPFNVVLSIEDGFGNSSVQNLELEKDMVPPVLSSVMGENSGRVNFSNQNAYTVSGSCDDASATISFSSGSESLGSVVCDGASFTKDVDLQSLSDGSFNVSLSIEDRFGNSSLEDLELGKDTVAPALSSVMGENSGHVNALNQSAYTVSGSCDDDSSTISFSSGSESLGSVACDGASFTKDVDLQSLSDGSFNVVLSIEDRFGNSSLKSLSLTKDIVAPALSSVVGENSGRVSALSQSAYTVSGNCDDATATISFSSGSENLGSVACDGTSFTKDFDFQTFPDGSFTVSLAIENGFGNSSTQSLELEKDTVAPVLSSVMGENSDRVNASNQSAYTVSGNCDDATATISFSIGSDSLGSVVCDGTSFEKDVDLQSLSDGSLSLSLSIEDRFGNSSLQNLGLNKDTVVPVLSSVAGENSDRVNAVNQSAYTISGSCDDATATISFSVGSDSLGSVVCDGASFTKNFDFQAVSDGPFTVSLATENGFGNSSVQTLELEKDVVAPVLSSVMGENSGRVNALNQSAYTVSGSCDDDSSTISFSHGSDSLGSVACDGTSFENDLDLQSLSESSFRVSLKIEDSFGNLSLKTLELEKDIVAPALSSVVGENSGRVKASNQSAYTVSGSCDDATATISFSAGSESLGSVACDGASFEKDLDLQSLSDGSLSLSLSIEDGFGNSSVQTLELEKEVLGPVLSSVAGENSSRVNALNQSAYTISGSCDDGSATISFSIGSESLGSVACDGASFTKDFDFQAVSDGPFTGFTGY